MFGTNQRPCCDTHLSPYQEYGDRCFGRCIPSWLWCYHNHGLPSWGVLFKWTWLMPISLFLVNREGCRYRVIWHIWLEVKPNMRIIPFMQLKLTLVLQFSIITFILGRKKNNMLKMKFKEKRYRQLMIMGCGTCILMDPLANVFHGSLFGLFHHITRISYTHLNFTLNAPIILHCMTL